MSLDDAYFILGMSRRLAPSRERACRSRDDASRICLPLRTARRMRSAAGIVVSAPIASRVPPARRRWASDSRSAIKSPTPTPRATRVPRTKPNVGRVITRLRMSHLQSRSRCKPHAPNASTNLQPTSVRSRSHAWRHRSRIARVRGSVSRICRCSSSVMLRTLSTIS